MTYLYRSEPSAAHYKYLSFCKIALTENHTTKQQQQQTRCHVTWNSWISTKNWSVKLGPVHMAKSCPMVDQSGSKMAKKCGRVHHWTRGCPLRYLMHLLVKTLTSLTCPLTFLPVQVLDVLYFVSIHCQRGQDDITIHSPLMAYCVLRLYKALWLRLLTCVVCPHTWYTSYMWHTQDSSTVFRSWVLSGRVQTDGQTDIYTIQYVM